MTGNLTTTPLFLLEFEKRALNLVYICDIEMTFLIHRVGIFLQFRRQLCVKINQTGVKMDWSTKGDPVVHFQHMPLSETVQVR